MPSGRMMKIIRGIERLSRAEKFAGKFRPNELCAAAGRAVRNQDGVANFAMRVGVGLADGAVMNAQLRQCFAGSEFEIFDDVIAFDRRGIIGREQWSRRGEGERQGIEEHS